MRRMNTFVSGSVAVLLPGWLCLPARAASVEIIESDARYPGGWPGVGHERGKKLLRTIDVLAPYVTNMACGADDPDTISITGAFEQWKAPFSGAVYRCKRRGDHERDLTTI
jgi:hypothetical protein